MIDFGEGVSLLPLDDESDDLRAWRNNPKIWRWTRQNDLISKGHHKKWLQFQSEDPTIRMYMVSQHGIDVGVAGLTSIDFHNSRAEFSLYINPSYQGKGVGKAALKTLFYHGFKNLGLRSIWGETFDSNPAQKMFEAVGMNRDGIRRQFYFKDGKFRDAIMFSVLQEEYLSKHGDKSCFC